MTDTDRQIERINQRWGQLHALEREYAIAGLKFVFLSNAGGAIATLSFIGTSPNAANSALVIMTLVLFVLGVVLYGVSIVYLYFRVVGFFAKYRRDVGMVWEGELSIQDLERQDVERTGDLSWSEHMIPLGSFACFVIGCILGGVAIAQ